MLGIGILVGTCVTVVVMGLFSSRSYMTGYADAEEAARWRRPRQN